MLTREQIETAAGRELDALVAEHVFGGPDEWVLLKRGLYYRPEAKGYTSHEAEAGIWTEAEARKHVYPHDEPVTTRRRTLREYSTIGDGMLLVLERMRVLGWDSTTGRDAVNDYVPRQNVLTQVEFRHIDLTIPHASYIAAAGEAEVTAKAALKAILVQREASTGRAA